MSSQDQSGFAPGAIVEFTQPDDPGHPKGERGKIVFKDYNGDFHILWEKAGAEVWSVKQTESELRLVSPPQGAD
jgi:hypothetical protein